MRELPDRTQRLLRNKLQVELKPELQKDVDMLFEQGPTVSSPFEFGSDESRNYYFWLIRNNPALSDGSHWLRRGIVEEGFDVSISDRLRLNLILIRNIQPEAKYVFGPWLVRGHAKTGWPNMFEVARQLIREKAVDRVVALAQEAVNEAKKK